MPRPQKSDRTYKSSRKPSSPSTGSENKPRRSSNDSPSRKPIKRSSDSEKSGRRDANVAPSERPYRTSSDSGNTGRRDGKVSSAGKPMRTPADSEKKSYRDAKTSFKKTGFRKDIKRSTAKPPVKKENDDSVRLNRYLASAGICSRREADVYIESGLVRINGKIVKELGTKVYPGDEVKFNDESIRQEKKVYILLNKPKDYITTASDEKGRKTVFDLIRGACRERVMPVGRLDRNTTGVLLLTNDGDMATKITHPKYNKKKIYHVFLDQKVKADDMSQMERGIELEDGFVKADLVSYASPDDKTQVGIEIHSGKYHVVRRLFEYFNYKVVKLDRVYFAGLTKKALPRGKWRFLTDNEITKLKMGAYV